ncbi:MAG: Gfo/Idh/MocA family oxidoreductase [Chloroflexi bacterium]|nr:Gfo/Idh/MocA family oxidoreductase [Chloroflexota bacterium]
MFYDLAGHLIDQIVWLLGRPTAVQAFLRNDASRDLPSFIDNALGVFSFPTALAFLDIAAMVPLPSQRRFEVYGTLGSAILQPLEPATHLILTLNEPSGVYARGVTTIPLPLQSRQDLYDAEFAAFLRTIAEDMPPDRPIAHEILVQETLLRATSALPSA